MDHFVERNMKKWNRNSKAHQKRRWAKKLPQIWRKKTGGWKPTWFFSPILFVKNTRAFFFREAGRGCSRGKNVRRLVAVHSNMRSQFSLLHGALDQLMYSLNCHWDWQLRVVRWVRFLGRDMVSWVKHSWKSKNLEIPKNDRLWNTDLRLYRPGQVSNMGGNCDSNPCSKATDVLILTSKPSPNPTSTLPKTNMFIYWK